MSQVSFKGWHLMCRCDRCQRKAGADTAAEGRQPSPGVICGPGQMPGLPG
jgi:hypothetical protein